MSATLTLSSGHETIGHKFNHLPRALKAGAAALGLLYFVAGGEIAADYAVSPQLIEADLRARVASTVWTGVAWPVVLHNTMTDEPKLRLGPLPKLAKLVGFPLDRPEARWPQAQRLV